MKNKELYYTPKIEDIRAGYQCEINPIPKLNPDYWHKINIGEDFKFVNDYFTRIFEVYSRNNTLETYVRTLYLTKEDIESEGWKISVGKDFKTTLFRKNIYTLGYNWENETLKISTYEKNPYNLFLGKCLSINEFRYITKELLNICPEAEL